MIESDGGVDEAALLRHSSYVSRTSITSRFMETDGNERSNQPAPNGVGSGCVNKIITE